MRPNRTSRGRVIDEIMLEINRTGFVVGGDDNLNGNNRRLDRVAVEGMRLVRRRNNGREKERKYYEFET